MQIMLIIILAYLVCVFFGSRFVIPYLGWNEDQVPEIIPDSMIKIINDIKNKSTTPREFLELSANFLGDKYRTGRIETWTKFSYLFNNIDTVWETTGFTPCTQSNFILRIFLVKSGLFTNEQIKKKHTMLWGNIHQYLQVKIDNRWIDVDAGEKQRGTPFGKHSSSI